MATLEELDARVSALEANASAAGTMLPPRVYTNDEVVALRDAYPGGADETYTFTLTYRDVPAASAWYDTIFPVYGVSGPNLGALPHNVLQSIHTYAPVSGPWPLKAPAPVPGFTGPTTDPVEILQRALVGQDWSGNPPCTSSELANRTATRDKVWARVAGAGADWYKAEFDSLTVLIMGTGFTPYAYGLTPGAPYPCAGTYDEPGVCQYLTGGGQPG